jgi:DNA-binding transcriptional LysR family regulator
MEGAKMKMDDLETLAVAIQEGSLTAAARRLFITQPAVSARLRRLEHETGEPLLLRSGQGVRPTSAGTLLADRAALLLEEIRRLEQEVKGKGPLRGRLDVGATDLVAIYHLPAVLRRFRRRHPLVELAIQVDGTVPLVRMLEAGQVALALATLPVPEGRFETVELYSDPLVVILPPGHVLAGRKGVDPARLAGEVWISHKAESLTRQLVDGFFSSHGLRLRVEMEISNPEAIKKLVQARLGLAVLPWCAVRREVADARLAVVGLRGFRLERPSGLILRRETRSTRTVAAFREVLVAHGDHVAG